MPAKQQTDSTVSMTSLREVKGIQFYKVLGGAEATLQSYVNATQPAQLLDDLDGEGSTQLSDWQALYTQFQADHVLGTVPYRWERGGYDEAILMEGTVASAMNVLVIHGDLLHSGQLSGVEKAQIIKGKLNMEPKDPLMKALGNQGMAACVKETEDEWELIVPHNLLARLEIRERVVARFRRHKAFPVTAQWCWEGQPWQPWDELDPPAIIPDLAANWIDGVTEQNQQT